MFSFFFFKSSLLNSKHAIDSKYLKIIIIFAFLNVNLFQRDYKPRDIFEKVNEINTINIWQS